jgi:peptidoglycan/LPS O-acetylase OafA/YrhL
MKSEEKKYRFEIDGLRAIAVLAVVLNHLDRKYLPNGFLGVDIFFVISGFVITSSLGGLSKADFSTFFVSFFERRMKRLLPALAVCVVLTSIAICFVDPDPAASLRTGMFALFGFANFYLLSNSTDYFARAAEANAFTQTWSLGVEEQYYLVFPALVWVSGFLRKGDGAARLSRIVAVASVASLGAYLVLSGSHPSAAFYLMPTRLWELGCGCLLYLYLTREGKEYLFVGRQGVSFSAALGLVVLLGLPAGFTSYSTLPAVLLTLVVIASAAPGGVTNKLLLNPVAQFVGRISYSLYLWHWSVLCLSRWLVGEQPLVAPFLLALMFALACASYFFVERPLRAARWFETPKRSIFGGLAVGIVLVACIALIGRENDFLLRKADNQAIELPVGTLPLLGSGLDYGQACAVNDTDRPMKADTFDNCTVPALRDDGQSIWVLGDSHAGHLQGLLYSIHKKTGMGVHLIETPGVTFPLNVPSHAPRQAIFEQIMRRARPGDLIVVSRIFIEKSRHVPYTDIAEWAAKAGLLAEELQRKDLKLVVLGPPPIFRYEDVQSCYFSLFGLNPCVEERGPLSAMVKEIDNEVTNGLNGHANAFFFDSFEHLCPPTQRFCRPIRDARFMFRDKDHLNPIGAASLTVPFLEFLEKNKLAKESLWDSAYQLVDFRAVALSLESASNVGAAESFGRWTVGEAVSLEFPRWLPTDFRMVMKIDGAANSVVGKQVKVGVGGRELSFVAQQQPATVRLDFRGIPRGVDTISLKVTGARSPKDAGLSSDTRLLGVKLVSLEMSSLD